MFLIINTLVSLARWIDHMRASLRRFHDIRFLADGICVTGCSIRPELLFHHLLSKLRELTLSLSFTNHSTSNTPIVKVTFILLCESFEIELAGTLKFSR